MVDCHEQEAPLVLILPSQEALMPRQLYLTAAVPQPPLAALGCKGSKHFLRRPHMQARSVGWACSLPAGSRRV